VTTLTILYDCVACILKKSMPNIIFNSNSLSAIFQFSTIAGPDHSHLKHIQTMESWLFKEKKVLS